MSLLENIRSYVRVVELGGLSAAGRHLRLSPAVISHRLQQLEEQLGVRLINRTTRQIQVTQQGEVFYQGCLEVLAALERAETAVSEAGATPRGTLRVTAPLGLTRRWLASLMSEFQAQYPHVEVRLRLSDHLLDLVKEGVDVAVRVAVLRDSSFVMHKIADCRRILCAAPAYLERHGVPARPDDLFQHNCLLLRFPGSQQFTWTLRGADGPVKLAVAGRLDADDGDVLTGWALAGEGIVMKPAFEVAAELRSGALVPVLEGFPPEPATLAVLYPSRQLLPAKVRAFVDFVVPRLRAAIERQPA
jgi:DNA-binding transcriptional LysR family regulator